MSFFDIERALQVALRDVDDIPDIAWPNTGYNPVIGDSFVRPTLLPAASENLLNTFNKQQGIYQIDIFVPTNKGIKNLYTIADNIQQYFTTNKRISYNNQTVMIISIDPSKSLREDAWYSAFVSLHYIAYF